MCNRSLVSAKFWMLRWGGEHTWVQSQAQVLLFYISIFSLLYKAQSREKPRHVRKFARIYVIKVTQFVLKIAKLLHVISVQLLLTAVVLLANQLI